MTHKNQSVWYPFTQAKTAPDPIKISRAKGIELITQDGKVLIDCVSSWWVNLHGHAHPHISKRIYEQAQTLEHVIFAGITHEPAEQLADKLIALTHQIYSKCFFSDNGSTSVEVALKQAYQYWHNQGQTQRKKFICFEGGYHGDTFGAMALGKSSRFFTPFESFLFEVLEVPYPEIGQDLKGDISDLELKEKESFDALKKIILTHKNTIAAMILEPLVQGASGMRMARPEFIKRCVDLLHENNILVIFDEVMTGFGRTGTMFAFEQCDIEPDFLCLSKGLTGGFLPMSVTLSTQKIFESFLDDSFNKAFSHGHSYTANPLGCAAALASLEIFELEKTLDKIQSINKVYTDRISDFNALCYVEKVRIQGTIFAFNIKSDDSGYQAKVGLKIKQEAIDKGLLLRPLGNVVYLLPPYCIEHGDLNDVIDKILTFNFF